METHAEPGTLLRDAHWRAFGARPDLDIDFRSADRPGLVTRVLAACRVGPSDREGEAAVWQLSVATRVGALLLVVGRTRGEVVLVAPARCVRPACRERFELPLPVPELLDLAREAEHRPVLFGERNGLPFRLRRPTGADQRRWRAARYASEAEATATVLSSLYLGDPAPDGPGAVEALADAMQEFDPLACFRVASDCPACGHAHEFPIDLEELLLGRLEAEQKALVGQVHRLASRYGWTEAEVLTIPPHRRRAYLALIDAEEDVI